jgi:hypothetical protein
MKSPERISKKQDSAKESQIIKDADRYNEHLEDYISSLENLSKQMDEHCSDEINNFKDQWVKSSEALNTEMLRLNV